jgi:hypothetical protein
LLFQETDSRQWNFVSQSEHGVVTDIPTFSETNNLQAIYTATGRIGYLWTPQFLGYVKGGMAFMHDKNQVLQPNGALFESTSPTQRSPMGPLFAFPSATAGSKPCQYVFGFLSP